jgi:SRSO17 transposase
MTRAGAISTWIFDDIELQKKGRHSVRVARQYCGQLGTQDNCQVAVSLSVADDHASLPVAYRLYLPESSAKDPERRAKVGVPEDVEFKTKPQIALEQIEWAVAPGLPRGVVLADAAFGVEAYFRSTITKHGLVYAEGMKSVTTVSAPGTSGRPPPAYYGRGRHPVRAVRDDVRKSFSIEKLAFHLPDDAWRKVTWRSKGKPRQCSFSSPPAIAVRGHEDVSP